MWNNTTTVPAGKSGREMQALCDKPKDQKEVQCRIRHMQRR